MRFVDRNVRKGARYTYIIQPARRFENDNMFIKGKEVSNVENKPYIPAPYNVGLTDSITGRSIGPTSTTRRSRLSAAWLARRNGTASTASHTCRCISRTSTTRTRK